MRPPIARPSQLRDSNDLSISENVSGKEGTGGAINEPVSNASGQFYSPWRVLMDQQFETEILQWYSR